MATVTISTSLDTTSGVTISAPTSDTNVRAYLNSNNNLAVSVPTAVTGVNLTSMGVSVDRSFWRLRNGAGQNDTGTITAYQSGIFDRFLLPANTDTFVSRPPRGATNILTVASNPMTRIAKASSQDETSSIYGLSATTDTYNLVGTSFADTLTGGSSNTTLMGLEGNDILNGGTAVDTFVFTNQGTDTVNGFTAAAGDVFAFRSSAYAGAPLAGSPVNTGTAAAVTDAANSIIVDTLANITGLGASKSSVRFAFATDTNALLYDADGNWSGGTSTIANVSLTGTPGNSNFAFVV